MANNYTHKKTIQDSVRIRGEVSKDGDTITYIDKHDMDVSISLEKLFKKFAGEVITLTLGSKDEEDLSEEE